MTNCPIASILIAFEMFGFKGVSFYLIAVSISYAASGYYGLYKDQTIVYSKYKAKFGKKAKMLTAEELTEFVGHAPGGVCPFAVKEGVEVYLDDSLKEYETVYPACGSSNSAIELSISEIEQYSGCREWVDVCADKII